MKSDNSIVLVVSMWLAHVYTQIEIHLCNFHVRTIIFNSYLSYFSRFSVYLYWLYTFLKNKNKNFTLFTFSDFTYCSIYHHEKKKSTMSTMNSWVTVYGITSFTVQILFTEEFSLQNYNNIFWYFNLLP